MDGLDAFPRLGRVPGLVHGITTRTLARAAAAERLAPGRGVLTPHQVHGDRIVVVEDAPGPVGEADGLATARTGGPLLAVLGADCPGVLLVDPATRALAVVHAGWRGIAARIVPAAVAVLAERFGAAPAALLAGIGPGIGCARYEVSTEVAERLAAAVPSGARDAVVRPGRPGHAQADLHAAIRAQLEAAGVAPAAVEAHAACTYDDARFHSHRRDGAEAGRHLLIAGWCAAEEDARATARRS